MKKQQEALDLVWWASFTWVVKPTPGITKIIYEAYMASEATFETIA